MLLKESNKHVLTAARTLKFQFNISLLYWSDCVLTADYLINRLPCPILGNKSPYEMLYHTPTSYSHLKVFGCLCFVSTLTICPNLILEQSHVYSLTFALKLFSFPK